MVAGYDTTFAFVAELILLGLGVLAAALAPAGACAGREREWPERVRSVLSRFSRWAGVEFAERRVARVAAPARAGRPCRPGAANRSRFSPGERHPRA